MMGKQAEMRDLFGKVTSRGRAGVLLSPDPASVYRSKTGLLLAAFSEVLNHQIII